MASGGDVLLRLSTESSCLRPSKSACHTLFLNDNDSLVFPRLSHYSLTSRHRSAFQPPPLCIHLHLKMESVITTSRSVIMHASLAHLSVELQTFDSIIRNSSQSAFPAGTTRARLPPELLLLIRNHLSPMMTKHLFNRSTAALNQYESSLRTLLCQDCVAYHQDVYGPDIWQWEQFSGPCFCPRRPGGNASRKPDIPEYWNSLTVKRQFTDRGSWLEFYLSFEASRRFYPQGNFSSIWDVVDLVLSEYNCQILGPRVRATDHFPSLNTVSVMTSLSPSCGPNHMKIALHYATCDLALSYDYQNGLEIWMEEAHPRPRLLPSKTSHPSPLRAKCVCAIQAVTGLVSSFFTFPMTFAAAILTLLCFYSKPRSLRLI